MNYQVELFEEEDGDYFSESLNKFLMLLEANRIKDIIFREEIKTLVTGEIKKFYIALVIYRLSD